MDVAMAEKISQTKEIISNCADSSFGHLFREMSLYILRLLSRLDTKQKKRMISF